MELVQVLQEVVSSLEKLGIPSMLVGSFASTYYGASRYTQDADLIVDFNRSQVDGFVKAFSTEFYVDRGLIEQALKNRSSFNVIHFATTFKVDFFLTKGNKYSEEEFARRKLRRIDPRSDFVINVQTAEDSLLSKLVWFLEGGQISENQWRDVIGILKNQAGNLDEKYLHEWAAELGVSDLLDKAHREARV